MRQPRREEPKENTYEIHTHVVVVQSKLMALTQLLQSITIMLILWLLYEISH